MDMKRKIWIARLAWIFYFDQLLHTWNRFKQDRQTIRQSWQYARGVASLLDDEPDLTPAEALAIDRQYWGD